MEIRSITYFTHPGWPVDNRVMDQASEFIAAARPAFENAGFTVQTARLATTSFASLHQDYQPDAVIQYIQELELTVNQMGYEYLSIGPAVPEIPESYEVIPEVIAATQNTFASGVMASPQHGIDLPAVQACAQIIQQLSPQDPSGFANLYFAALANVPPGAPFFPAAYHQGDSPAFAIATEAADLAVTAFSKATSLTEARHMLTDLIETNAGKLAAIADTVIRKAGCNQPLKFGGIDFSPAPYPKIELSLGTAMERLGVNCVGEHGSLSAAAIIADTIDKATFPHTGFSGMMLPLLEDATLAARAAQGILTIKDLLLYSAVCGTGLDTVPLPGNATSQQLEPVLLDLASLAMRLNKPLTARLMPIPGAAAGDYTQFDFPYFANSRVMDLDSTPLTGLLAGDGHFTLHPRDHE